MKRGYVEKDRPYTDYQSAYKYGWESREKHSDKNFDEVEHELGAGWAMRQGASDLDWPDARPAVRDAWDRVGKK